MAHMKVEASVRTHRKFLAAGPAASWLWVCGMGYCQDGLTDGLIPAEAIGFLGVAPDLARELAAVLVHERLWHVTEGGWRVHDYLEYNRSAAAVVAIQTSRATGGRLGGRPPKPPKPRQPAPHKTLPETLPETLSQKAGNLTVNPSLLRSDQIRSDQISTDGGAETAPPTACAVATTPPTAAPRARADAPPEPVAPVARAPIHDRAHRLHAHCGRVCLPAALFGEFVRRRNHADADREIRDWAMTVDRDWSDGGPHGTDEPGDGFAFWQARYAERWPAAASARKAPAAKALPAWAVKT